jgi:hypothetical protein
MRRWERTILPKVTWIRSASPANATSTRMRPARSAGILWHRFSPFPSWAGSALSPKGRPRGADASNSLAGCRFPVAMRTTPGLYHAGHVAAEYLDHRSWNGSGGAVAVAFVVRGGSFRGEGRQLWIAFTANSRDWLASRYGPERSGQRQGSIPASSFIKLAWSSPPSDGSCRISRRSVWSSRC